jgi:GTP cyclohydrolase II
MQEKEMLVEILQKIISLEQEVSLELKIWETKVTKFKKVLMPDILHWLGIKKIDRYLSMSNMKYDAIVNSGIKIIERYYYKNRVEIPDHLVPEDAKVEMNAKVVAGYFTNKKITDTEKILKTKGRELWYKKINL